MSEATKDAAAKAKLMMYQKPTQSELLSRIVTLEAERDELRKKVEKLRSIMQFKPGFWSDESRLRSLAESLEVPNPNRAAREDSK